MTLIYHLLWALSGCLIALFGASVFLNAPPNSSSTLRRIRSQGFGLALSILSFFAVLYGVLGLQAEAYSSDPIRERVGAWILFVLFIVSWPLCFFVLAKHITTRTRSKYLSPAMVITIVLAWVLQDQRLEIDEMLLLLSAILWVVVRWVMSSGAKRADTNRKKEQLGDNQD